jgi:hypothetical protein
MPPAGGFHRGNGMAQTRRIGSESWIKQFRPISFVPNAVAEPFRNTVARHTHQRSRAFRGRL